MAKRLQHRGGTTSQHSTFTGAVREVTVDTDKNTLVVHDGATAGGHPLATATNFQSTGIDDNATSTAVTIDSSQNVTFGGKLTINTDTTGITVRDASEAEDRLEVGVTGGASAYLKTSVSSGSLDLQAGNVFLKNTIGTSLLRAYGSSSTGDIAFYEDTGTTPKFYWDASAERLGIGTASPSQALDVNGSSYPLVINSTNGNLYKIQFKDNGVNRGYIGCGSTAVFSFANSSASELMRINNEGQVGFGITPNLSGKRLYIDSTGFCGVELFESGTRTGAFGYDPVNNWLSVGTSQAEPLRFFTGSGERMRIDSSGNVGIGTTSPSGKLDVRGSAIFNEGGSDVDFRVESNNNANMLFVDGGNDRIGVGTNSPQAKLSIAGAGGSLSGASSLSFYDTNSASSRRWSISNGAGGNETSSIGQLFFSVGEGSVSADPMAGTAVMVLTKSARIGVGTSSPESVFHVSSGSMVMKLQRSTDVGNNATHSSLDFKNADTNLSGITNLNKSGSTKSTGADGYEFRFTNHGNGYTSFFNNGSEAVRINSDGSMGIGTTNIKGRMSVSAASNSGEFHVGTNGGTSNGISVLRDKDDTDDHILHFATAENSTKTRACEIEMDYTSNAMIFRNGFYNHSVYDINDANDDSNFPERMKFNSSNLQLNGAGVQDTSNPGWTFVGGPAAQNQQLEHVSSNTGGIIALWRTSSGVAGNITTSGTSTSYNTSSDYRLKENVSYDFDATTRLKQLRPARFNFISDTNKTVDGFLAHEVSSVVPEAITGTHNEVEVWKEGEELPEGISVGDNKLDGEGNTIPVYQGIDQSKLVPLLVKTIQELEARITTLETNNP